MQVDDRQWMPSRARPILGYAAFLIFGVVFAIVGFGDAWWLVCLMLVCSVPAAYQNATTPILRIRADRIEHIPFHTRPRHARFGVAGYVIGGRLEPVLASEIEKLEWDGVDNIGVRLRTGDVTSISFLALRPEERPEARRALLAFVARTAHAA